MHCSFHADAMNKSRQATTTHTDEDPRPVEDPRVVEDPRPAEDLRPAEETDLPSLQLQQHSLYDQIRENCRIPEVVAKSTPDVDYSLPSSPRTIKCEESDTSYVVYVIEGQGCTMWT